MGRRNAPGTLPRLGSYEVLEELGRGGTAHVFLGEHEVLGRRAALKVLSAPAAELEEVRERFLREARVGSLLKHENLVEVYDFGEQEGRCFAVMELLEGETLADRLEREEVVPMTLLFHLARQLAGALEVLHQHGVVHCDVKPSNILLEPRQVGPLRLKLIDYGVCMMLDADGDGDGERSAQLVGTPEYMAPEQIAAERIVPRTDVYAFGAVLYEMLAGEPPFRGALREVLVGNVADEPPGLPLETPPQLARLIASCLSKDPEDRPPVREAIDLLEEAAAEYRSRAEALDRALGEEEAEAHPAREGSRGALVEDTWFNLDLEDARSGGSEPDAIWSSTTAILAQPHRSPSTAAILFLLLVTACAAALGGYFVLGDASPSWLSPN